MWSTAFQEVHAQAAFQMWPHVTTSNWFWEAPCSFAGEDSSEQVLLKRGMLLVPWLESQDRFWGRRSWKFNSIPYLHVMPIFACHASKMLHCLLYACLDSQFVRHSSDIRGSGSTFKKKRFARNMPIQDHTSRIALHDLNFDIPLAPAHKKKADGSGAAATSGSKWCCKQARRFQGPRKVWQCFPVHCGHDCHDCHGCHGVPMCCNVLNGAHFVMVLVLSCFSLAAMNLGAGGWCKTFWKETKMGMSLATSWFAPTRPHVFPAAWLTWNLIWSLNWGQNLQVCS